MDELRNAHKKGEVLGLKGVTGVVPRIDIDKLLFYHPDTFNLFALALIELKNSKGTDWTGYFQLGGIHGLPKAFWDGVDPGTGTKSAGNTAESGYCAHSTTTFPTWHRPYLALIEQSLYLKMLDIAESFKDDAHKKLYRDSAQTFRLPYWDYYRPRGGEVTFPGVLGGGMTSFPYDFAVPKIFTEEKIMLKTPDSPESLQAVDNPFRTFVWTAESGQISADDWNAYEKSARPLTGFSRKQTLRYPDATNGSVVELNWAVNKARHDRMTFSLQLMGDKIYQRYRTFASEATKGSYGSLESIHGNYHGTIGGTNGHMSRVPVAAFDPIFWFHHCQIDRWCAVWQAIHPNAWFEQDSRVDDPLYPFRNPESKTKYWDSNLARETADLGYTYPDSVGDSSAAVLKAFQDLYSWAFPPPGKTDIGKPPKDMEPLPIEKAQVFQYTAGTGLVGILPNPQEFISKATAAIMEPVALAKQVAIAAVGNTNPDSGDAEQPSQASEQAHELAVDHSLSDLQESGIAIAATKDVDESKYYREWYVDDVVERLALNGAFTIYYFVGPTPAPDSNELYAVYPTMAGASHVFAAPEEVCDNCGNQAAQGHVIYNTAPITAILRDYIITGSLADLSLPNVKPFLVKNLKWKIVTADGIVVDPRTVAGLKLGVSSRLAPVDGGDVSYQEFPEIITEIIENASPTFSPAV